MYISKICAVMTIHGYRILLVNSHGYYKFQVEIGTVTNRDSNKIVLKA